MIRRSKAGIPIPPGLNIDYPLELEYIPTLDEAIEYMTFMGDENRQKPLDYDLENPHQGQDYRVMAYVYWVEDLLSTVQGRTLLRNAQRSIPSHENDVYQHILVIANRNLPLRIDLVEAISDLIDRFRPSWRVGSGTV